VAAWYLSTYVSARTRARSRAAEEDFPIICYYWSSLLRLSFPPPPPSRRPFLAQMRNPRGARLRLYREETRRETRGKRERRLESKRGGRKEKTREGPRRGITRMLRTVQKGSANLRGPRGVTRGSVDFLVFAERSARARSCAFIYTRISLDTKN